MTKTLFNLNLRVRYGECDAQQVVFNARYADYVDVAMTEYFRALIGGFQVLTDDGLDNQVVSLHIDWLSSAAFDDLLTISVHPVKIGNTSYSFDIQIQHYKSKTMVAKASITYVLVSLPDYKKTPIPDWLRQKFTTDLLQNTIDQTGGVLVS
jgi:acyl-CoA thioester hydrolase